MTIASSATACGILAMLFWSVMSVMVVWSGAVPPFLLVAITSLIGAISILSAEVARGFDLRELLKVKPGVYLFGTCGIGVYMILLYLAFKLTSPFTAATLNYLWPIFLAIFLSFYTKRKLHREEIAGLVMGLSGTLLLFTGRYDAGAGIVYEYGLVGAITAFAAAVLWAAYSVKAREINYPTAAVGMFFVFSASLSFGLHLLFEDFYWPKAEEWIFVILLGLGRISYSLWDYAMKHGDRDFLTSLSYLVPLISTSVLVAFGYVPADMLTLLAGILIVTGCLVINFHAIQSGIASRFRRSA